jgi:hypothetical protein
MIESVTHPILRWLHLLALAPMIPPEWPIYRIVNALAMNVGQARNFTDPKA